MFELGARWILGAAIVAVAVLPAHAEPLVVADAETASAMTGDAQPVAHGDPLNLTPENALRFGVRAYLAGNISDALRALEMAATDGSAIALWKLGKMYAEGDGVVEDDRKAFDYFSRIADAHAEDNPRSPFAGVFANAFVQLGQYHLNGIDDHGTLQDERRALSLFRHAATYFGDAEAQYNLARLYLAGETVDRDPMTAARWLALAAEEDHIAAQALLGDMLVTGIDIPQNRVEGFKWLLVAGERAGPALRDWVLALMHKAGGMVSDDERQRAELRAEQWLKAES